jgi:hypothetical protein
LHTFGLFADDHDVMIAIFSLSIVTISSIIICAPVTMARSSRIAEASADGMSSHVDRRGIAKRQSVF